MFLILIQCSSHHMIYNLNLLFPLRLFHCGLWRFLCWVYFEQREKSVILCRTCWILFWTFLTALLQPQHTRHAFRKDQAPGTHMPCGAKDNIRRRDIFTYFSTTPFTFIPKIPMPCLLFRYGTSLLCFCVIEIVHLQSGRCQLSDLPWHHIWFAISVLYSSC